MVWVVHLMYTLARGAQDFMQGHGQQDPLKKRETDKRKLSLQTKTGYKNL